MGEKESKSKSEKILQDEVDGRAEGGEEKNERRRKGGERKKRRGKKKEGNDGNDEEMYGNIDGDSKKV